MSEKKIKKILVVDDSPTNLLSLKIDLVEAEFDVLTAEDGIIAWDLLQQHKEEITCVLLDRIMPNLDGIEFMGQIKADTSVHDIPVIMQTAARKKHQIIEGIQAGVYYYLTKPYDKDIMLSIVGAAIQDYDELLQARQEIGQIQNVVGLLQECNFELQTIQQARNLAPMIANFFPNPGRVVLGISELLVNAIEHGNLGITYDEKSRLMKRDIWREEVERRRNLPEYRDRRVRVSIISNAEDISLWIRDEGKGFDWVKYLEISPERATDPHGRGIAMSKMLSFDAIQYIGRGNEVMCKIYM